MITHTSKLTSSEIAMIWSTYIEDTMALCVLNHFLEVIEDPDIKEILQFAQDTSMKHISFLHTLFNKEGMATPQGFTDADWNKGVPRLYSDVFNLRYLAHMGRGGMAMYSMAKATSSRSDIRKFFTDCWIQSSELYDKATETMIKKGFMVRSPIINYPQDVSYVQKNEHFLSGGGFIGDKRPLLAIEISHIATNIETNSIGMTLLLGFAQSSKDSKVTDYIKRGFDIAQKHVEMFSSILRKNNTPAPATWDSTITASTTSPFSEKLMLFHVNMLIAMGIGNYGAAMGANLRMDLGSHYTRLTSEIMQYAKDGVDLMISKGYMEKPPQTLDRENLINQTKK